MQRFTRGPGSAVRLLVSGAAVGQFRFARAKGLVEKDLAEVQRGFETFDTEPWTAAKRLSKRVLGIQQMQKKRVHQRAVALVEQWAAYARSDPKVKGQRILSQWRHVAGALTVMHSMHLPLAESYRTFQDFFERLLRDPINRPGTKESLLSSLSVFAAILERSDFLPKEIAFFAAIAMADVSNAIAKDAFKVPALTRGSTQQAANLGDFDKFIGQLAKIRPLRQEWTAGVASLLAARLVAKSSTAAQRCAAALSLARHGLYDEVHAGGIVSGLTAADLLTILPHLDSSTKCPPTLEAVIAKEIGTTLKPAELEIVIMAAGSTDALIYNAAKRWLATLPTGHSTVTPVTILAQSVEKCLAKSGRLEGGLPILSRAIGGWLKLLSPVGLVPATAVGGTGGGTKPITVTAAFALTAAVLRLGINHHDTADTLQRLVIAALAQPTKVDTLATAIVTLTAVRVPPRGHAADIARARTVVCCGVDGALTALTGLIDGDATPAMVERALGAMVACTASSEGSYSPPKVASLAKVLCQYLRAQGLDSIPLRVAKLMLQASSHAALADHDVQAFVASVRTHAAAKASAGAPDSAKWGALLAPSSSAVAGTVAGKPTKSKKRDRLSVLDQLKNLPTPANGLTPGGEAEMIAQEALEAYSGDRTTIDDRVELVSQLVRLGYRRTAIVGPVLRGIVESDAIHLRCCARLLEVVAVVDRSDDTQKLLKAAANVLRKSTSTLSRETVIPIVVAAGNVAATYPETAPDCALVVRACIAWVLHNLKSFDAQTAITVLTAFARARVEHPTATHALFGHVNDFRNTLALNDIPQIAQLVEACGEGAQELKNGAKNVGRSVVAAVVGGAVDRGNMDLSASQLEILVDVLSLIFAADRTTPDIFRACVQRRRDISPECVVGAFRLGSRMPTLPPEWNTLAEHVIKNVFSSQVAMDAYGPLRVLLIANEIVTAQPNDANRDWLTGVEAYLAHNICSLPPKNLAKLFWLSFRAHRSESVALKDALYNISIFLESIPPTGIHIIVSTMFSLHVKNGRALKLLLSRAADVAKEYSLVQLRTLAMIATKTKVLNREEAEKFGEAIACKLDVSRARDVDVSNVAGLMLFYAKYDLVQKHFEQWRGLIKQVSQRRAEVTARVAVAVQVWDALSTAVKLQPPPAAADAATGATPAAQPLVYVDPDLFAFFEKLSATLPKLKTATPDDAGASAESALPPPTAQAPTLPPPVLEPGRGWGDAAGAASKSSWGTGFTEQSAPAAAAAPKRRGWA